MRVEESPNIATFNAVSRCEMYLSTHHNILVSLSGGADSDIMLDLIQRVLKENKYNYKCNIRYVFFDTGIEYQATKQHLDYLEKHYNITIERIKAKVPVPLGCKKYGQPFLSKDISAKINSLQNNKFDFKNDGNKSYEELLLKYPKCKSVLKWWCNVKPSFNINSNIYLKEFMILYPPTFKISERCCNGAKKDPSKEFEKNNEIDLKCLGLRKCEGGVRATKYSSCYSLGEDKAMDNYRPLWWFTDSDKQEYKDTFNIKYSGCYEDYGFKRTGCAGCPFNSKFEEDIKVIEKYEPKLFKAVNNIFGDSYEYTRAYRKFKAEMKEKEKQGVLSNQISIFDLEEDSYVKD